MSLKRLTSLVTACLMALLSLVPAFAEGADAVVRSAPLTKSGSTLDGMVRVYLSSMGDITSLNVTVAGSYTAEGARSVTLSNGQSASISFSKATGQITMTVNGTSYAMGTEMAFRRHQTSGESGLRIAQASRPSNIYSGDLQLIAQADGSTYKLYPIMHVYMAYYLYGVVPYEMSSSSPIEALKAQAVAARTYTLKRMDARESKLYDVVDTSSDQVYKGHTGTENNATLAVDGTKGIVIMNNGVLSGTYYTSSNGGQTEAVVNAWGSTAYPYLRVKDDPYELANPNTNKRTLTVNSNFSAASQNSTLKSLMTAKAQSLYGSSVTIRTINSITPHTPKYPSPSRLYTKMDFGVTLSNGSAATLTFAIFDELESPLSMSINSTKNELWSVSRDGSDFVITVGRHGHGIGMSQRGAQQMARMGYTYDQILGFYYEGCTRVQHTFTHTILPPIGSDDDPVVNTEPPATIEPDTDSNARIQLVGVSDSLPLRYTPSESGKVLIAALNGAYVNVLSYGSQWSLIRYGQINGYVPTAYLVLTGTPTNTGAAATNITQWGTVTGTSSLNLRDGAGYSSNVIGSIPGDGVVAIFSVSGSWAHVQYGQQVGYCSTSYLTLSDTYPEELDGSGPTAMVSLPGGVGSAPLYSTASTSGTVIMYVNHGTQVTVQSNDGSWCRVTVSGVTGYVLASALDFDSTGVTPTDTPLGDGEMYAIVASEASTLNLRSGPSTAYEVIAEIPRGTLIVVTSYGSEWCAIRWGSLSGYVMTAYLSFDVDAPTNSPTSAPTATPTATYVPVGSPALIIANADLHTAASSGSEIQLMIPTGETVTVLSYGTYWTQIAYASLTGYVLTSSIELYQDMETQTPATPTPTPTATVSSAPTATPTPVPTYLPTNELATLIVNANMREEPDTSSAMVTTLPAGTLVTVVATGRIWSQILYGDLTGWVLTTQLDIHEDGAPTATPTATPTPTPAPTAPQEEQFSADSAPDDGSVTAWIVSTVSSVNLRASASSEAELIGTIPGTACITVLKAGTDWSYVRYEGMTGYVFAKYITDKEPLVSLGVRYINTQVDPLALRDQPSTSGKLLTRMDRGETVTLLKHLGDWCLVQYGQQQGYCATRYLSTVKPDAYVPDDTRLLDSTLTAVTGWEGVVKPKDGGSIFAREWCATDAPEVMELDEDTRVTVLQKGNIWCLIAYEGNEGYCLTSQLTLIAPAD